MATKIILHAVGELGNCHNYMEVFEHYANNLWSHCAWHIALFLV